MAFTVPNFSDAIEYPVGSGTYPQAQPDAVDWQILGSNNGVGGVVGGCEVTQRGAGANQSVDVSSGSVTVNFVETTVTSGNLSATAAHATLPRFDLVSVNSSGTKVYTAGTAATTPVFPAIPATSIVLAAVFRRPTDDVIQTAEIVDKRVFVPEPLSVGSAIFSLVKTADESVTNSTTLQDDNELVTGSLAAGTYFVELHMYFDGSTTGDMKIGWSSTDGSATFDWLAPGTSGGVVQWGNEGDTGADNIVNAIGDSTSFPCNGAGTTLYATVHARLILTALGDLKFRWAQNTVDAGVATRVLKGSILRHTRVV